MARPLLLLGIDGGGTACRARLMDLHGEVRGEGSAGPANIRFGLRESFTAVLQATHQSLEQAGLSLADVDTVACLALAGAGEPTNLAAAQAVEHPFSRALFTTDAHAACVGAHGGKDGHPFPVPLRVYDQTIGVLRQAVDAAKLGNDDRLVAVRELDRQARALERVAQGPSFEAHLERERQTSQIFDGRTV